MKNKGLTIQFIALLILMVLVILTVFYKSVLPYADLMAGITFFVMAYNKKDQKSIMYFSIVFGILFILLGGYNLING